MQEDRDTIESQSLVTAAITKTIVDSVIHVSTIDQQVTQERLRQTRHEDQTRDRPVPPDREAFQAHPTLEEFNRRLTNRMPGIPMTHLQGQVQILNHHVGQQDENLDSWRETAGRGASKKCQDAGFSVDRRVLGPFWQVPLPH
jgi:hypothetical protein